jgi:hypothetical protein
MVSAHLTDFVDHRLNLLDGRLGELRSEVARLERDILRLEMFRRQFLRAGVDEAAAFATSAAS